ncbi:glycosyltransferase family 2 protein [Roseovarius sp. S4756]|uniref:glycosyltransferase family 2 protein n=1 Tax=Roseovarius maritimus TaxID=3342637 RepID=UPI0037282418
MARTLIICPTFDHADTLFASVASVQAQKDHDWELVVICDGSPDRSVDILTAVSATDPRVRFIVQPKGERLGEAYRDPVIRESNAEFVCHIGDDDLWAAQHLDVMTGMLKDADFAMQASLEFGSGGTWAWNIANLGTDMSRELSGRAKPVLLNAGLNNFAVRRDAYLRLPRGWSPSPVGMGSDVFMCVEYVKRSEMRVASSAATSFVKLPSRLHRKLYSPERRLAELMPVLARINERGFLQNARSEAVLGMPIMRAMFFADAGAKETLETALHDIGLKAVGAERDPVTAINASVMEVPLTASQLDQCEMAWLMLRCVIDDTVHDRLSALSEQGLAWLMTPYLEVVGQQDVPLALRIADVLEEGLGLDEIGNAYRIRAQILSGLLEQARIGLDIAEKRWPEAGWLHTMQIWHRTQSRKNDAQTGR